MNVDRVIDYLICVGLCIVIMCGAVATYYVIEISSRIFTDCYI